MMKQLQWFGEKTGSSFQMVWILVLHTSSLRFFQLLRTINQQELLFLLKDVEVTDIIRATLSMDDVNELERLVSLPPRPLPSNSRQG